MNRLLIKLTLLCTAVLISAVLLGGCAGSADQATPVIPTTTLEPATATLVPPTETASPVPPTATASPTDTATLVPSPTETPLPTETPTPTLPPPTPSGEDAIYIYYVQPDTDGPVACGDSLVPINTGLARSGDVEADVASALKRLFSKVKGSGELVNPAYLSNIEIESVTFKEFSGLVDVQLKGTYVRSGDHCDDWRVREQVWNTIRQFEGVKTVYILLNGNLLGDILATKK